MRVIFTSLDIDKVLTEMIVFMHYEKDVPFKGLLGLFDWRLNGRLSRFVQAGKYQGRAKELLLVPAEKRLKSHEVMVLGLGKKEHFEQAHIGQVLDYFLETIAKKKTEQVCFSLSELAPSDLDWGSAVKLLLTKLVDKSQLKEVILREPAALIREAKRRGLSLSPQVDVVYQ